MYVSPFAYLMNEYKFKKNSVVSKALRLQDIENEGYKKQNMIFLKPEYIKQIESNKIQLNNQNFINCVDYIDEIYNQETNCVIRTFFYERRLRDFLNSIYWNIINKDSIMNNVLGVLYKYNGRMINLLHPLNIIHFMSMENIRFKSNDFIVLTYPDKYKEMNTTDDETEKLFYNLMEKTINIVIKGMQDKDETETNTNIYIDFKEQEILQNNNIKDNVCIFPIDKMAAVSLVPFYGWNYAVFKNNKFVGDNLITNINITGNISSNTYCTGKLEANLEGLESLRGNNLNSAYNKLCIDISNNHSWIKANIRMTKFLLEKGLKNESIKTTY